MKLTTKLILAFLLVSLFSIGVIAAYTRISTSREFDNFVNNKYKADLVDQLANYYKEHQKWDGVEGLFNRDHFNPTDNRPLFFSIADANGKIIITGTNHHAGEIVSTEMLKTGTQIQPRHKWNLLDPDILAWEYAAGPRDAFLYKLTEVRRVIEPSAAKLAASRATDDEIASIEQAYQQMAANLNDIDAFIGADMQFHAGIVRASHNEILEQIVNVIREALVASRKVTLQLPNSGYESLPRHYAILAAIKDRNEAAAQNAMDTLINSVKSDLDRSIEFIDKANEG